MELRRGAEIFHQIGKRERVVRRRGLPRTGRAIVGDRRPVQDTHSESVRGRRVADRNTRHRRERRKTSGHQLYTGNFRVNGITRGAVSSVRRMITTYSYNAET